MQNYQKENITEAFLKQAAGDPGLFSLVRYDILKGAFTAFSVPASGEDVDLDTNDSTDAAGAGRHMQRAGRKSKKKDDCSDDAFCLMMMFNCPMSAHHHAPHDIPADPARTYNFHIH